ncbi:MAG: ornithine carbamoyltransferase [Planctomycetota bacterium]
MAVNLKGRNFVSVKDFSTEEIRQTIKTAEELKLAHDRGEDRPLLAGKTLAMIFQKPSLRTRTSFEAGMTRLGGHAIYLAPSDINLGARETTEDIAIVLSRYADIIMARTFGHDIVEDLAKHATFPVMNGLSDHEHPCQVLADLLTVYEKKGRLENLKLVYVGDGNNVAHSLMYGGALTGMHVTVCCPQGFEPKSAVAADAQQIGQSSGAKIAVTNDLSSAADADVLYTDVWASMGQESEAAQRKRAFQPYQVNKNLLRQAKPDATILHCLPAHYGEEIDYETSRLPNSAIFDQAENRLHAQNALMVLLTGAR